MIQVFPASREHAARAADTDPKLNPHGLRHGSPEPQKNGYRPDIDGLRAVAVLSVIVYHLGLVLPGGVVNRITGGFVGVDIFFVISGYLITGLSIGKL